MRGSRQDAEIVAPASPVTDTIQRTRVPQRRCPVRRGAVVHPMQLSSAYFSTFFLDGGTVAWPNGADIAPETLYAHHGVAEEAA